jgi:hypothetical protein
MSKAQNRNMGSKRRQGKLALQMTNNVIIQDLAESEGD